MKIKHKIGVFILCMFLVVGLLPPKAEANDIRNRVLTYNFDLSSFKLNWNYVNAPYGSTSTKAQSGTATINGNIGIAADGNSIQFQRPIEFNRYFPSGWVINDRITITGLHQEGLKKALVMVSNNPNNPEDGVIAKDEFKFFKASI